MKCQWKPIFLQATSGAINFPKSGRCLHNDANICLGAGDIVDELMEPTRQSRHLAEIGGSARRNKLAALISASVRRQTVEEI